MFQLLEPIFDGSLISLPEIKSYCALEPLCVFFRAGENVGDLFDLGRIMRSPKSSDGCVSINIFRPPFPEEQIQPLTHSSFYELIQIVQSTEVAK